MKELEAFMKAFGIVTETARRNVIIAIFGIMFLFIVASISFGIFMYNEVRRSSDKLDKDKDKIYREWLDDVREKDIKPVVNEVRETNKMIKGALNELDSVNIER